MTAPVRVRVRVDADATTATAALRHLRAPPRRVCSAAAAVAPRDDDATCANLAQVRAHTHVFLPPKCKKKKGGCTIAQLLTIYILFCVYIYIYIYIYIRC